MRNYEFYLIELLFIWKLSEVKLERGPGKTGQQPTSTRSRQPVDKGKCYSEGLLIEHGTIGIAQKKLRDAITNHISGDNACKSCKTIREDAALEARSPKPLPVGNRW